MRLMYLQLVMYILEAYQPLLGGVVICLLLCGRAAGSSNESGPLHNVSHGLKLHRNDGLQSPCLPYHPGITPVLQDNYLAQDALTGLGVHSEGSEVPRMKVLKNLLALSAPNTFHLCHAL